MQPLAVITGVGPGTGSALVRRFSAGGFQVAMLARDADVTIEGAQVVWERRNRRRLVRDVHSQFSLAWCRGRSCAPKFWSREIWWAPFQPVHRARRG